MAQAYWENKEYYETIAQRLMIKKSGEKLLYKDTSVSTLKHTVWKDWSTLEICHVQNISPYKQHSHKALHSVRKENHSPFYYQKLPA